MKEIFGYIGPFLWRYLENLLLIVRKPFSVFSERVSDPRYFTDSLVFLGISCLVCTLLATVVFGALDRIYIEIEMILGSASIGVMVLLISLAMYCSWWIAGYRGSPGAIMMPFIYAGGSLVFCWTVVAVFGFGALKRNAPDVFDQLEALGRECRSDQSGMIDALIAIFELRFANDGGASAIAPIMLFALVQVVLMLSTVFGAYRTAFSVYRLRNRFFDFGLFALSIIFLCAALWLEQLFSAGIDIDSPDCVPLEAT